ncbi:hypothetical protein V6N13_071251 [Hibiscus sabdariffa]
MDPYMQRSPETNLQGKIPRENTPPPALVSACSLLYVCPASCMEPQNRSLQTGSWPVNHQKQVSGDMDIKLEFENVSTKCSSFATLIIPISPSPTNNKHLVAVSATISNRGGKGMDR